MEQAKELRKKQTPAEEAMWAMLRNRQLADLKFRRQHQIGDYIVDFFCSDRGLIVELDGPVHDRPDRIKANKKQLIAYNLIRCVMQQTAIEAGTAIGELSFKGVLDHTAASQDSYLAHRGKARRPTRHHESVIATCATKLLDIRPSRHEPRALKRRCKDYPPLTSPRGTYREKPNKGKINRAA